MFGVLLENLVDDRSAQAGRLTEAGRTCVDWEGM